MSEVLAISVSSLEGRKLAKSDHGAPVFSSECFQHVFESQARRTPDRIALAFAGHRLTYAELNARSNRIAHHLQRHGVSAGTCVALLLERSLDMIVALLGVLKAGGAYVPLFPESPQPRLAHQLGETEAA